MTTDWVTGADRLEVVFTGELLTVAGRPCYRVRSALPLTVRAVIGELVTSVHPGFGGLLCADGVFPGLGPVMILHNGTPVDRAAGGLEQRVGAGTMYLIPPIPGG